MEALASGVPIVGYSHGGAREAAFHLLPEGAVEPLADGRFREVILAFLRKPPAVPDIPASFGLEAMTASILGVYKELGLTALN